MRRNVAVILLAGGVGSRMKMSLPKQFIPLKNKPIARHSFDLFLEMEEVKEIILVCSPEYRAYFPSSHPEIVLTFAPGGERRQDSVWNGFQAMTTDCPLVCIHDSARPFITQELVRRVMKAGEAHGAATVGMPIKFTVKECNPDLFVKKTPDRSLIWEIQTPQVIRADLLKQGFEDAISQRKQVTDDVSLIENLGFPVKLVEGCYSNIKITTPEDLVYAQSLGVHGS